MPAARSELRLPARRLPPRPFAASHVCSLGSWPLPSCVSCTTLLIKLSYPETFLTLRSLSVWWRAHLTPVAEPHQAVLTSPGRRRCALENDYGRARSIRDARQHRVRVVGRVHGPDHVPPPPERFGGGQPVLSKVPAARLVWLHVVGDGHEHGRGGSPSGRWVIIASVRKRSHGLQQHLVRGGIVRYVGANHQVETAAT